MQYFLLIGKKVIYDILTEPDRVFKNILIAIMAVLLIIFMFVMPIVVITNIPLVYLSDGENTVNQEKILKMYKKDCIDLVDANYQEWVKQQKEAYENEGYEVSVDYNFNINYKELIAVDTILLKQDFTKADTTSICSLIDDFVFTDIDTGTYVRTYTDEEMGITGYKENGEPIFGIVDVQKEELVKYAKIKVSILNIDEVMNNLGFSETDKNYVESYIKNIGLLELIS